MSTPKKRKVKREECRSWGCEPPAGKKKKEAKPWFTSSGGRVGAHVQKTDTSGRSPMGKEHKQSKKRRGRGSAKEEIFEQASLNPTFVLQRVSLGGGAEKIR